MKTLFLSAILLMATPALARAETPDNFLVGIRSINVVMHRERVASSTSYLVFAVHYGAGNVWYDKAEAMALPARECAHFAKSYGGAACYRTKEFRALRSSPPTVAELRQR